MMSAKTKVDPSTLTREAVQGSYETWTSPFYAEVRSHLSGAVVKRFRGEQAPSMAARYAEDLHLLIHS